MDKRTSSFILGLISLLLLTSHAWAQQPQLNASEGKKAVEKGKNYIEQQLQRHDDVPLLCGVYLSADVFGFIYPFFTSNGFYNNEVSLSVNLKNRFQPVVEVGYGHCNTLGELYDIRYATAAPYYRIGMDYNFQYRNRKSSYIIGGARVGYSQSTYEVEAPALDDDVFGTAAPFHLTDMPCRALWAEALVGVRVQMWKNLYLCWTVRYKRNLSITTSANGNPWFVPGFGAYGNEAVGATYSVSYYLH
ncbi:MAG: hypothetical protein J5698_01660 [Bacteroidaceae bacterium]|nr:hypothetical protein [Bacteroidaceae bacterium]MBR5964456.1 hypothetical protein [Bacteroidaceae bacterium]